MNTAFVATPRLLNDIERKALRAAEAVKHLDYDHSGQRLCIGRDALASARLTPDEAEQAIKETINAAINLSGLVRRIYAAGE